MTTALLRPADRLYTATRVLATLELLAFGPTSARELAEYLHVDTRTARRLLRRLTADGWARRGPPARWELTPRLFTVAACALATQAGDDARLPCDRLLRNTGLSPLMPPRTETTPLLADLER